MTYLWSGMILIGIIYGALTGNFKAVTEAAVSSGKDADKKLRSQLQSRKSWNESRNLQKGKHGLNCGRR